MLPSRYRGRYALFILLSLLVHFAVVVVLFWSIDEQQEKTKSEKTVIVKLKQKEEPKKEEPKKEEPKKAEPKKEEPKKAEPKKAEPKKAEPKKAEPKKEEPKKAEPKKAEPKKAEPKKVEPKKVEPKKVEPKKVEPKKAESKKAEPKKVEPKKAEPKQKQTIEDTLQYKPYQSSVDVYNQQSNAEQESLRQPNELLKYGSMTMLDDREMKRAVVYTKGYGSRFQERDIEGQRIKQSLSFYEKQLLNNHLVSQMEHIFSFYKAPKKDGGDYFGEVSILLDEQGYISHVTIKTPSGSNELDDAVYQAVKLSKRLSLPTEPLLRKAMVTSPLTLNYSEEDMAD